MVLKGNSNCPLIVIRWCLGWYIVAMLLLIGPARDGKYNTFICRGSLILPIKPLGPDAFDVVSDVLEIVRDIIIVSVRLVALMSRIERKYCLGLHTFTFGRAI